MDRITEIRTFAAVADARSFAQGARRLGISPAQATKLVARLEDHLGARLLNRTTRDVSLTDTGRAYLERARDLLDQFDALEGSVREQAGPCGLLKLSAPVSFGAADLRPALMDFATAYPDVGQEVYFSDRTVNLVEEGFDMAVRITRMADSSLIARKLAEARIITCASPDYLAREGAPQSAAELADRDTILDLNLKDPTAWTFGRGAKQRDVRVSGRLRFGDPAVVLAAARSGFGIARAPAFVAADDLRAGRLITVLHEEEPDPMPIQAVYPHARHLASKVRAFVDFLAARFSGEPCPSPR
jgi:DNA-binding transcriptional LysR family regulator